MVGSGDGWERGWSRTEGVGSGDGWQRESVGSKDGWGRLGAGIGAGLLPTFIGEPDNVRDCLREANLLDLNIRRLKENLRNCEPLVIDPDNLHNKSTMGVDNSHHVKKGRE